ncbi:MAG: ABC transporter ATP-binding protein [Rickettsiales bacterium]|nr:ABC transporter ATP-binding protein [Rickettsiales bacterium]
MSILELKDIVKSYSTKVVLDGVSLNVEEGEVFGLIGLNGAGKTTMIKTILHLLTQNAGTIKICNIDAKNNESRQNISYLPEKFQPSQQLKVIEFIKIFSDNENFDIEKIKKLCDILDLDKGVLNKKISSLSKGMSQKVGLIASFIDNKKLVILDEPMSGLDPKARINLKNLLLEYKNNGNSIFFSSHILADIDEICDRIAVLNGGKIQFVGTPNELKSKYSIDSLEKAFLREIEG